MIAPRARLLRALVAPLMIGSLIAGPSIIGSACASEDGGASAARLPDLVLPPLAGEGAALRLAELDGPAVVNLWATWCAPCRRELPAFQEVSAQRPDVAFVGVDVGDDPASAQAFLDRLGVTFPQYSDEAADLSDALGVASLPVTLVVDADGQVVVTNVGPMTPDSLAAALDEAS